MIEYDTYSIVDKGFENEDNLNRNEWKIFIISYFESLMDMEGWDHFFSYKMEWYQLLVETLNEINDEKSLNIIYKYKKHVTDQNIEFTSQAIDDFLCNADEADFDSCPDWRAEFSDLMDKRRELVALHFKKMGITLKA